MVIVAGLCACIGIAGYAVGFVVAVRLFVLVC